MEAITALLLGIGAFFLGACPFSLLVGRWFLHKDIRQYGDANPGAWNVMRAGGRKSFALAMLMDGAKGILVVLLADLVFHLPLQVVYGIGFCAILGHAFSPFLRFRGGKAVAVTYGVLLALPDREMILAVLVCTALSVLIVRVHAWVIVLGAVGGLTFVTITDFDIAKLVFVLGIVSVFIYRCFPELKAGPGYKGILVQLIQAVRR